MRITFGMFLDGADWSEKPAALGEIKMGPLQFLPWLETRLGLGGVSLPEPERIDGYMRKIRRVDPEWCRESFETDSWSTAKQMLAWRDELFENGWDGKSAPSERFKALAAVEADPGLLSPGVPDRMKAILRELETHQFSNMTLALQGPFELLPWMWRQVIGRLWERGMMSAQVPDPPRRPGPKMFQIDGANEFLLARECARFLAAGNNERTALICEGGSAALDGALHRAGLGRLNAAESSRWRESLQILPLWLDTLWAPFNPQRFLELLLLPMTPIPSLLARELVKALQKEPGRGGGEWKAAWQRVTAYSAGDGDDDARKKEFGRIEAVWTMLEEECFKAEQEIPAGKIVRHCDFLVKRLGSRVEAHPELAPVIAHAKTLGKIVAGREKIRRMELARILDSIIGTGTTGKSEKRERTDFAVFTHPGMIDRDFDTVLWWNFIDEGAMRGTCWTSDEIGAMPGYDRKAERKREKLSWNNALAYAAETIIFFVPGTVRGDTAFPHPLRDELMIDEENVLTPEKLTDSAGKWSLAGRTAALEKQQLFEPKIEARIEKNSIRPLRDLSYSQLERFIACPFRWFMEDYVGLEVPPAMAVPTGPLMLGKLAHKVVEEICGGRETLTVEEARRAAGEKFDELLPSMAGELLLDGRGIECDRIRETLVDAVGVLVTEINNRKLLVKGNEKKLNGTFQPEGTPDKIGFVGYSDIYLEDPSGGKFVIDMKWSSASHYEKDLKKGKALQLAVYSWLLAPEDLKVRCAYFLFPRREFIYEQDKDWSELWAKAKLAWKERLEEIRSGKLARGTDDEKKLESSNSALPLSAGCTYCSFKALCKLMKESKDA